MPDTHWLDAIAAEAARRDALLVVCRTSATVREVLRRLAVGAEHGEPRGHAGLQVTTLRGLLAAAEPGRLFAADGEAVDEALPASHSWARLLAGRPGLRRMLAERVRRAHEARAAGVGLAGLRPELQQLVEARWAAAPLPALPGRSHDCVIAVGFGRAPFTFLGGLSPLDRRLLERLAPDLSLGDGDPWQVKLPSPLPALRLADTSAEARAVAREGARAASDGGRVLVLVSDVSSAERIAAALRRNGVAVADDGAVPLTRHALVSAVRPLLPVFASCGQAPADGADLLRLFTDPVLSRGAPGTGTAPVPELGDETPRASTRHVRDLLASCRRARAPLAAWLASLAQAERLAAKALAEADADSRPSLACQLASARVLLAKLEALAAHARGGRLRDVGRLLTALKLSDPEGDRLGRAVVGALAREGFRPATAHDLDDALAGGVASGRIDRGAVVLPYESYDGRDADLLLLCGVHEKGLARMPAPDPFLGGSDLAVLGLPGPAQALAERLALARWAASRARRVLALVASADASGRAVSPPVDLALAFDDRERGDGYGLDMELPERRDRAALAAGAGAPDRLAVQVDAEWVRRGAAFGEEDASPGPGAAGETLAEQLLRDLPRVPADLRPWIGEAGVHPRGDDGLPRDFVLSASRLGKFTACLYQGFLDSVLRLRPPRDIAEELDPREVGSGIHAALEAALAGAQLLVPDAGLEEARARLVERLVRATEHQARELAEAMPADAEALRLARDGYLARWDASWTGWVEKRLRSVEDAARKEGLEAVKGLDPALVEAVAAALGGPSMAAGPRKELRRGLLAALVEAAGDPEAFVGARDAVVGGLSASHHARVSAALKGAAARSAIEALCAAASGLLGAASYHPSGDLEVVGREVRFGDQPDADGSAGAPLEIALGRAPVRVRGSIDLVLRRRGREGTADALRVRDYKTGGLAGKPDDLAVTLLRPQLALYALVLEAAGEALLGGRAGGVEHLMLDHVKGPDELETAVGAGDLDRVRTALGRILDRARDGTFPPLPHPSGCPELVERGAYCEFAEVCRIRARYQADEGEEVEG